MKIYPITSIVLPLLSINFMLAGCSPSLSPLSMPLTEEQSAKVKKCQQQLPASKKIKLQTVSTGCMASFALNRAIGSNNPAPLICLAGGTSGFLFGSSIAERQCRYFTLADQLAGEIQHAKKMNTGFKVVFAKQSLDLKRHQLQAAAFLNKKNQANQQTTQLNLLKASLQSSLQKEQSLLQQTREEANFKQRTLLKSRSLEKTDEEKALIKEIQALQASIRQLQENQRQLAELNRQLNDSLRP